MDFRTVERAIAHGKIRGFNVYDTHAVAFRYRVTNHKWETSNTEKWEIIYQAPHRTRDGHRITAYGPPI